MKKVILFRSVTLLAAVVAVVACGLVSPSSGGDAVEDKMGHYVRRAYDSHVERKARGADVESPMLECAAIYGVSASVVPMGSPNRVMGVGLFLQRIATARATVRAAVQSKAALNMFI